jgi:uncharacterized membrane protein
MAEMVNNTGAAFEMSDPLDLPATPVRLRAALGAIGASENEARRAYAAAGASPHPREWIRFGSAALLLLGAGLVLAGVISFFAFNWADLGRFERFALLQAAIAACTVAGWRWLDDWTGRVGLFAAAVLVGPLLGVYGQAYQTGADPWGLFAAWAALIVPWVLAARFTALWLLLVALVDVALVLFCIQVLALGVPEWLVMFPLLAAIHSVAVAAWEWQYRRDTRCLDEASGPRLLAATGFTFLMVPSTVFIMDVADAGRFGVISLLMLAAAGAGALTFYRSVRRDLFMLTAAAGTVLTLVAIVAGRVIFKDLDLEVSGLLLMAMVVVAEVALVVTWLRSMLKDWATP